jgi:general secretion pathway protein I
MSAKTRTRTAGRDERAFTLIEVLIALAIVSISLAAFVRLTSQSTASARELELRTLAMLSAQNSMNELRMDALPPPGDRQVPCPQADRPFVCDVSIGGPDADTRRVTVTVRPDRDSARRIVTLESRIGERGG